jgi:hypothetical protein
MRSTIEMASGATVTKTGHFVFTLTELKTFEALVRADERSIEREACAKVCEDLDWSQDSTWEVATLDCAEAIRARGETK